MNVFITGGSGYSGQPACLEMAAAGHQVRTISRDPSKEGLRALREREVEILNGSIAEPESYREAVAWADVVIHNVMDHDDPEGSDRAFLDVVRDAPKRPGGRRRLIYTTGCSIYGPRPETVMDENTPGNPDHALYFRMELETFAFGLMPETGVVVLRPGFMYGNAGQSCQALMWVAQAEDGSVTYRGNREKGWSWVHVQDLARAFRLAAESDRGIDGEVYCIADELRPTCVEVMRAGLEAVGYEGEITYAEPDDADLTSIWFDQNEFITSRKAFLHLGWAPAHRGIVDGMAAMYQSWKAAGGIGP